MSDYTDKYKRYHNSQCTYIYDDIIERGTMLAILVLSLEVWKRLVSIFFKWPLRLGSVIDMRVPLEDREATLLNFVGACEGCFDLFFSKPFRNMIGRDVQQYLREDSCGHKILTQVFAGLAKLITVSFAESNGGQFCLR